MDVLETLLNRDVVSCIYKHCFDKVLHELKNHKKVGISKWKHPSSTLMCLSCKDLGSIQHPYHEFMEFVSDKNEFLSFPQGHLCGNCNAHKFPCLNCDAYLFEGSIPGQLWNIDWK